MTEIKYDFQFSDLLQNAFYCQVYFPFYTFLLIFLCVEVLITLTVDFEEIKIEIDANSPSLISRNKLPILRIFQIMAATLEIQEINLVIKF